MRPFVLAFALSGSSVDRHDPVEASDVDASYDSSSETMLWCQEDAAAAAGGVAVADVAGSPVRGLAGEVWKAIGGRAAGRPKLAASLIAGP